MDTILIVLLVLTVIILVLRQRLRRTSPPAGTATGAVLDQLVDQPSGPISFGYKMIWLAVHCEEPRKVISALGLRAVHHVPWSLGFQAIYGDRRRRDQCVFVTPPVRGWVLVASVHLPEIGQTPDVFTPFMQELSRRFGNAQYFGTHRVVDYHAWARAENGVLLRAYAYLGERGETLLNSGEPTRQEVELGLLFKDDTIEDSPDEEDVLRMAGAWSVNPNELGTIPGAPDHGWLGTKPECWPVTSPDGA